MLISFSKLHSVALFYSATQTWRDISQSLQHHNAGALACKQQNKYQGTLKKGQGPSSGKLQIRVMQSSITPSIFTTLHCVVVRRGAGGHPSHYQVRGSVQHKAISNPSQHHVGMTQLCPLIPVENSDGMNIVSEIQNLLLTVTSMVKEA